MRCGGILRGVEFGARPIGGNRLRGRPRSRGVGQPTEYAVDAFEESGGLRTCGLEAITWEKSLVWWGCVERQPLLPGGWLTRFVIFATEKT